MKKYLEIYHDLQAKILSSYYPEHNLLPSDMELVSQFEVSRGTVRKAIRLLADEGYIQTIRGKGSIVLEKSQPTCRLNQLTSSQDFSAQTQQEVEYEVLDLDYHVPVPKILNHDKAVEASQKIVRRCELNHQPYSLEFNYINQDIVKEVPAVIAQESLLDFFEKVLNLKIDYAVKHITIEPASDQDCELLAICATTPIVVVRSELHLSDGRIVLWREARHRGDKFKGEEFARRHPTN